ncbi:MAG: ABC transporter substrate-binding protein [Actinomycetota bacterium]|nr:MAG: ABC transporter substrate-binding protein [Actinomycetota bacterium]
MFRATWRSLLARKLRLLLTAGSIVLGVGFVAGTYVLTDTMNAAFEELFARAASGADLVVRSRQAFEDIAAGPGTGATEERRPIPEALLEEIASVPGVEIAAGDVSGAASIVDPDSDEVLGGLGPPTIGTNWTALADAVLTVREGRPPDGPGEVAIDAGSARTGEIGIGDRVPILTGTGREVFEVVGILGFGPADNLGGATLAVFDTETAQRLLDKEGVYDTITVKAEEDVDPVALRAAIQARLPKGLETVSSTDVADENAQALREGLGFFRTALLVFAAVALFVGGFLILNTFSIIVAQRTRELALLRTLGATRAQVLGSVVVEAAIVGVLASAVGVGAGVGIAIGLRGLLGAFGIDLPTTAIQLEPRTVVVSIAVGLGVTILAAVLPARHAARVAPLQALRDTAAEASGSLARRALLGGAAALAGVGALAVGLFGSPSNPAVVVGVGAALTFAGVAVWSPFLARPVAGALGAPFERRSVPARLGRENARRNPRRTAATASALMIGLGLVSMVAILAASLKASLDEALRKTLKADLTLSTTSFTPFSPAVARRVAALPEVGAVGTFRQAGFKVDGDTSFLTGLDPSTVEAVTSLGVSAGSLADLRGDAIAVASDVATERGWSVGDRVPAAFPSVGERPLRIVAIYDEDRLVGDYVVPLETYEDLYVEQLDAFVLVRAAEGVATDEARRAVEAAVVGFPNVDVQDQAAFREKQAAFIDQLLGLVTALLMMAIVIALFGIVNTLGLSIYERTRELGLLRAVGMSRAQVRRMIRWEAVIIAVFGALLGLAVGIGFGWALRRALEPEGVTRLALPAAQLGAYLAAAALAGVLAAVWPARRASRLDVLASIAYE